MNFSPNRSDQGELPSRVSTMLFVALVVKDVATDFRYVYPAARRSTRECIAAFKHFVRSTDDVGVFYSDNSPELIATAERLGWRHQTSFAYVSKTNAMAERSIRSVIDGTRVNLEQAGLHHQYWAHAARHACMGEPHRCPFPHHHE